jgi:hypothetical protein
LNPFSPTEFAFPRLAPLDAIRSSHHPWADSHTITMLALLLPSVPFGTAHAHQNPAGQDVTAKAQTISAPSKLSRTYAVLLDALNRHRGKRR